MRELKPINKSTGIKARTNFNLTGIKNIPAIISKKLINKRFSIFAI